MRLICFFALLTVPLFAEAVVEPENSFTKTSHTLVLNQDELHYTATVGKLTVKSDSETAGKIFFVSYSKDGTGSHIRPITFIFNGGPGSSSVWLHMGAFGPKKIISHREAVSLMPPYQLKDNDNTLLDVSDLVFIDPVGTGFSTSLSKENIKDFCGVNEDAQSIGEFIGKYLSVFNKWDSPTYIAGESYGSIRALCVAKYLSEHFDIFLNGLILISPAIDWRELSVLSTEMEFAFLLPSYAATAWYHQRLPEELQNRSVHEVVDEASVFAMNEYCLALMKGDWINDDEREKIVEKMEWYTGIAKEIIKRTKFRLDRYAFATNLLKQDDSTVFNATVGFHDTRMVGFGDRCGNPSPSDVINGGYTSAINAYIGNALNYREETPYKMFSDNQLGVWHHESSWYQFAWDLSGLLLANPFLKVFTACGYYDIVTPFCYTQYALSQLHLPETYRNRSIPHCYEGGHMFYLNDSAHEAFKKDLAGFFDLPN